MTTEMHQNEPNSRQSTNHGLLGTGHDMRVLHHCECACRIGQARKRLDFGPAIESNEAEHDRQSIWDDGILATEHLSCDLLGSNSFSCPTAKMAHL